MDREDSMKVEALFAQALELPAARRADFLLEACGDDSASRDKLGRLLAQHERPSTILDLPIGNSENLSQDIAEALASGANLQGDQEDPGLVIPDGGTIPFGDYLIESELGRGAMGLVYRAQQQSLKRTVALKMIRSSLLTTSEDIARFKLEAEAAASLEHPNIVPIYETGEHEGQHYFSMKLIAGGTLKDHLEELRLAPRRAVQLLSTVARAVHAAHQHGILHRDLKPGNILIDEHGEPHLTDFGLAKQIDGQGSMTLSGQIIGTPYYMAPEQAEGGTEVLTCAGDVYSLGAIFYQVLTGALPHKGSSLVETLKLVATEEPLAPRRVDPGIDRDLGTIILKCLDKLPGNRYQSAAGLADDLDRWLRGEPVEARPLNAFEQAVKWVRRKPMHAAFLTGTALCLLALSIGGPLIAIQQRNLRVETDNAKRAEVARADELRHQLYFADMVMASQMSSDTGGSRRLRHLLDKWIPTAGEEDLRGWEWYLLMAQDRAHIIHEFQGHTDLVRGAVWSPDGTRVASGGYDRALRVWEPSTGREIWTADSPARIEALAWDQSGDRIATGGDDGQIQIWTVGSDQAPSILAPRDSPSAITQLAWGPSSDRLASGAANGIVRIHDAATGADLHAFEPHRGPVTSLSWAPDGSRLASSSRPGSLRVRHTDSGETVPGFDGKLPYPIVAWSPNGRLLAGSTWENGIVMLKARDGEIARRLSRPHEGAITSLSWNPESTFLASSGIDHTVRVRNAMNNRASFLLRMLDRVRSVEWSPDRIHLAICAGNRVTISDLRGATPPAMAAPNHPVLGLSWSPDGTRLVSIGRDKTVRVWNPAQRRSVAIYAGHTAAARDARWSPDGKHIASVAEDICIWDPSSGDELLRLPNHGGSILGVDWSPDGERLASLGDDQQVRIWDAGGGKELVVLPLPTGAAAAGRGSLRWSPDGAWLAAAAGSQLVLWEGAGFTVHSTISPDGGTINTFTWSPDSRQLGLGTGDGELLTIDRAGGEVLQRWIGHNTSISCLNWSPDGSRLASAGNDLSIRFWDSATGSYCLGIWAHQKPVLGLSWSPDGSKLASGSSDTQIIIWDGGRTPGMPGP